MSTPVKPTPPRTETVVRVPAQRRPRSVRGSAGSAGRQGSLTSLATRRRSRPLVSFSERRAGTTVLITAVWLVCAAVLAGVLISAALLTVMRHAGLDLKEPEGHGQVLSRAAWNLSR